MILVWSDDALSDLLDAYAFIAAENPSAAERVQDRLIAAAEGLRDFPRRGRVGRADGTRETPVAHTPYMMVYSLTDDTVTVLRLWHGAREPFT